MSLSLREVAVAAPFQLSLLTTMLALGFAKDSPEHAAEIMQLPVAGMIAGALVIAVHGVIGYKLDRAATRRTATKVLHP